MTFDPQHVSVAANGSLLALSGGNGITIISSKLKPIHRLNDSFESSHFSSNGLLWACAMLDSETVMLEIRDPQTWAKVARTKITAKAPMTRYSTLFEFNNAINSRNALLSGIGVAEVSELDGDTQALFRSQLRMEKRVGLVPRRVAVDDPDNFLHSVIVSAC